MSKKRSGNHRSGNGVDRERPAVILGQEFAAALAAEKRRQAKGRGAKSPMPAEEYPRESDELGLLRPRQCPLDSALARLTRRFAKTGAERRAAIRGAISLDEFYTLLEFSRRAAVFALRERKAGWLASGLTAVAMIEVERIDWRDLLLPLSLLNHTATRIGADADQLFQDAVRLSEPDVAQMIEGFVERNPKDKSIQASWGFDEVEVDGQLGLTGSGFVSYRPRRELTAAAIEIADFIAQDRYCADGVEIATALPPYWLETENNTALKKALKAVRGCASVHAHLKPGEHPDPTSQFFCVWVLEVASKSAIETLLERSGRKTPKRFALLGVAEKELFCLVVAASCVQGVKALETAAGLRRRFSKGLAQILHRTANTPAS